MRCIAHLAALALASAAPIRQAGCNVTTIAGFPPGYPNPDGAPFPSTPGGNADGSGTSSSFFVRAFSLRPTRPPARHVNIT